MRIRLHHEFGAHTGRVHDLGQAVIRIGRLPDNDVAFDPQADIDASGRHAEIRFESGDYFVSDAGSRNGTFVNGNRITKQKLSDGDVIECGKGGPRLRVEIPTPAGAAGMAPSEVKQVAVAATVQSNQVAPPPAAPASAPAPAAQPGKRTIGMMIQQALGKGGGKSTAEIHAVAMEAAHKSSRKLKIALFVVSFLLLAAIGGGVGLWWVSREEANQQNAELRNAYGQLFNAQQMDQVSKAQLEARVGELNRQLEEASRGVGSRIAQGNAQAVFLLVAQSAGGPERGYCTAFAVAPTILATNAHCVEAMQQMALLGQQFAALPNGGQGGRIGVTPIGRHPMFLGEGQMSADVGLLRLTSPWPSVVRVAGPAELAGVVPGDTIFVYGFPGQLNEPRSPVATLTTGIVGRVTGFDGGVATPDRAFLVQHSAFTSPGTSGSPIFDDEGRVIAVNTGAYRGLSRETMIDQLGQRTEMMVTQDLHGYAFGVRVDLVQQLLLGVGGQ